MAERRRAPRNIYLYLGLDPGEADREALADFLRGAVPGCTVEVRDDFLSLWVGCVDDGATADAVAERIARARVRQPDRPASAGRPLPGEIKYERRFLTAGADKPTGLLYDGELLMQTYARLLPQWEVGPEHCHVVLTEQLPGTWDGANRRYHARAAVFGVPTVVSASGLVQGPARPREVYVARSMGLGDDAAGEGLRDRYLDRDDPRLKEALKGYLLQALFYHVTGDPFCRRRDCRLYNAHWQEELIAAQTGPDAGLCGEHGRMLEGWKCA